MEIKGEKTLKICHVGNFENQTRKRKTQMLQLHALSLKELANGKLPHLNRNLGYTDIHIYQNLANVLLIGSLYVKITSR